NGEDGRLVETVHGQQQAPPRRLAGIAAVQLIEEVIATLATLVERQQLGQARADTLAQFGGGGSGVGNHQDLPDRQLALQKQACVQRGQGPGLAGAGAGLDQRAAIERRVMQIEFVHSPSSSPPARACSAGPSSCSASCSKRSPSGSRSRKARAYQG